MTMQQEICHQHNGFTMWDYTGNNVSSPLTLRISGLGLDTIISALVFLALCMVKGE